MITFFRNIFLLVVLIFFKTIASAKNSSNKTFQENISLAVFDTKQNLSIFYSNKTNPVILLVHGGPGMAEIAFTGKFWQSMCDKYTICFWDQRGAGKSYRRNLEPTNMNLNQLCNDGALVTDFLLEKFQQKKIFIVGHSWGTLLASTIINKFPEKYYCYFGIGQVGNQYESEKLSFDFVLKTAIINRDKKACSILKKYPLPLLETNDKIWFNYLVKQRQLVAKFGGAMYKANLTNRLFKGILKSKHYSLKQKVNYYYASKFSVSNLWKDMLAIQNITLISKQSIPIYIFQGKHDYQTCYKYAQEYFERLDAPEKQLFTFDHSAHLPHLEEAEKFKEIFWHLTKKYIN